MAEPFNPEAHPQLIDLGQRLRALAGDAAYKAGRQYLAKGAVRAPTVMGATAYATVSGSTDYRVSLGLGEKPAPHCTCPAYRRNRFCKHVVALSLTLLERAASVTTAVPSPGQETGGKESAPPKAAKARSGTGVANTNRTRTATKSARPEQQAAGLATVERVLLDLAEIGMSALEDEERAGILRDAGQVVRARKLRRLANLIGEMEALTDEVKVQRIFEQAPRAHSTVTPSVAMQVQQLYQRSPASLRRLGMLRVASIRGEAPPDLEGKYAALLRNCWLTLLATKTALADPEERRDDAEDLAGKTWRDEELPLVEGLHLLEVGWSIEQTRGYSIDSRYAVDLVSAGLYLMRSITPRSGRSSGVDAAGGPVWQRGAMPSSLIKVREARIYPGPLPQRLKLVTVEHLPLHQDAIDELVARIPGTALELRRRLSEHLSTPIGYGEPMALFRPSALLHDGKQYAALDERGTLLRLAMSGEWARGLAAAVSGGVEYALAGRIGLSPEGLQFSPFSAIGAGLRGVEGPVYS